MLIIFIVWRGVSLLLRNTPGKHDLDYQKWMILDDDILCEPGYFIPFRTLEVINYGFKSISD